MTIQLFVVIVFTDAHRVSSIPDTQWGSLHQTCIVDQPWCINSPRFPRIRVLRSNRVLAHHEESFFSKVKRTEIMSHCYCFEDNLEQYGVK
ncbi:hypothetical protein C8R41DRAFT_101957 [Lentinula lateritia]|uniref:Secreted protein n=1 Tax=Lentinula lateritia TaxID=40482 RepID=A0ABQ8VS74_9AGAR|nr:hypothetical protein C8R41DRAFT_101957 [Lentinula lateritia]